MPFELLRWTIAERFGWTLAEVDALTGAELAEFFNIEDGKIKASADVQADNRPVGRKRR